MKADSVTHAPPIAAEQRFVPRDRDSFLEAQRRNRRATWRISVACVLATVIMGIPLALTVTPLLYAAGLLLADVVGIWVQLPPAFWRQADALAHYGFLAIGLLNQRAPANPQALAIGAAVLLLPGTLLSIGLWLAVIALFKRAGVGGALLALKAREPDVSQLRELQLSDAVQEMAIASGLPAPAIMIVDAAAANAAAIGTSPKDARIVVTRGLLDTLNRDELEGVLASIIASIGNGDLRIAFRLTSVFETYGLLLALINSPFGSLSRKTLWRIVRLGLGGRKTRSSSASEAAAVADLLTRGTALETDDIDQMFDATAKNKSVLRSVRNFILFPIFLTNFTIKLALWFFSFILLEPCMALLWRKRKYLADACAVQLTRNPDGLAEALRKLNADRRVVPGGSWAPYLFLVNPAGSDRTTDLKDDRQQMLAQVWAASAARETGAPSRVGSAKSSVMGDILATGRAAVAGDQNAVERLTAFRHSAAGALNISEEDLPDISDLAKAQDGDQVAVEHLMRFAMKMKALEGAGDVPEQSSESSSSNFAGFFPSLKRRLKRLDRMGAHVELDSGEGKAWIVIVALSLLLGPFALAAVALLLLLIAILSLASLTFLAIWMAFIHKLFIVLLHR